MPTRKKRLKIKTVIHRAREYINHGAKAEAIDSVIRNADYTAREAEALVEFIGNFFEGGSDRTIVFHWCDEHRMPRFVCRDQHCPETEELTPVSVGAGSAAAIEGSKCACSHAECDNEWHRLAMWIRDNPQKWHQFLQDLDQHIDNASAA